jgi:hypothetical protein
LISYTQRHVFPYLLFAIERLAQAFIGFAPWICLADDIQPACQSSECHSSAQSC